MISTPQTSLEQLLTDFGIVTVMNVKVYKIKKYTPNCFLSDAIDLNNALYLNTLKISNIKESGPKKVFKAGINNIPAIRYGKTVSLDMTDALGCITTLRTFFGLQNSGNTENNLSVYSSNKFAEPIAIEGMTYVLDLKGQIKPLYIFIPYFVPKSLLNLTQDPTSDFGVFDLSGELYPVSVLRANIAGENESNHIEYYSLSYEPIEAKVIDGIQFMAWDFSEDIEYSEVTNISNNDVVQISWEDIDITTTPNEEWTELETKDRVIIESSINKN